MIEKHYYCPENCWFKNPSKIVMDRLRSSEAAEGCPGKRFTTNSLPETGNFLDYCPFFMTNLPKMTMRKI